MLSGKPKNSLSSKEYHDQLYRKYVRAQSIRRENSCRRWIKTNILLLATVFAVFLGVVIGIGGRKANPSEETIVLVSFPGEVLVRMLNMIVLPMIASSMITGLSELRAHESGRIGTRALVYYFATTFIASVIGIACVLIIQPGIINKVVTKREGLAATRMDTLFDFFRNMCPTNLMTACFEREYTHVQKVSAPLFYYKKQEPDWVLLQEDMITVEYEVRQLRSIPGMNVVGIVTCCIVMGILLGTMEEEGYVLVVFFKAINGIIKDIFTAIMWYAPVGVLFLVAGKTMDVASLEDTWHRLGMYMATILAGLSFHCIIVLSVIYFITTFKNPFVFIKRMSRALLTTMTTGSSDLTLPVTFRCLEENLHVDKRITEFILPFASTVNMDGTALYECVAAIFVAQVNNVDLTIGELITIGLIASLSSMGASGVPSAGLATILLVLASVGLPTSDLSYILCVDWIMDRFTTAVNVFGDAYGASIVEQLSTKELEEGSSELATHRHVVSDIHIAQHLY